MEKYKLQDNKCLISNLNCNVTVTDRCKTKTYLTNTLITINYDGEKN